MRKFRILAALLFTVITGFQYASAQVRGQNNSQQQIQRCATEEAIERRYQTDPMFRAMMDQRERDFQQWRAAHPNGAGLTPLALSGPVTIPVVVHVVLPNPNIILESDVEYLINRLNLDFSGLNPDSTNGVPFYSVRGHSLIRFCLAKRDPSGNFTNGIERRVGAGTIGGGEPQAIKSFGSGGLDPWNVTQYYNIWVGQGGGLLGIAPEIGPGTAASDGVCINYQAFANNPCYTIAAFNLGRTAVHEIGHNFGLWHTFQGGCANQDMQQLSSAGCLLPGGILGLTDDTPGQSASTSGCPAGTVSAGCAGSPNPPGKQYQNYMDYTDDACYSMFSNTQVERMHWVLENCRAGYLTANGCSLPAGTVPLDAAVIEVVSPGGSEIVGCSQVNYPVTCPGNFTAKVRVQNRGSSTMTSVTIQVVVTGAGSGTASVTAPVNLAYGKSAVVTITNPVLLLGTGSNTVTFNVIDVNGSADGNAANNSIAANATVSASAPLPVSHDFVPTTPFLPAGWSVVNPNGNNTWVRNNNGNGNAGSAFIDNYNFNLVGQTDDIRTPTLTVGTGYDSVIIDFDYAHKNFPGFNDRLQVMISADCGGTFTTGTNPVFDRSGATLSTAGTSTANYTTPAAGDWQHNRLAVFVGCGSPFYGGNIVVSFRGTNGYGNNIFIDNINITGQAAAARFQPPTVTPPVCVGATGSITINTIPGPVYEYSVNNGATWQASSTFTGLVPGNYNLAIRILASPSCVYFYAGNAVTLNPAPAALPLPQTDDFVAAGFPPANLSIFNPNGNNTWVRNNNGNGNAGSAFIDNYNFNLTGQVDEIRTVALARTGVHFINVGFDLAHKNFPGFNDRLQVLYSLDCGVTWLATSFDRSGATLATAGSSTANYTTPAAADWVRQNVVIDVCGVAGNDILITWKATNGYGNNIFIDNISIDGLVVQVNQPANQIVCNGSPTTAVTFSGSTAPSTVYNWTNSNTSIGLAASGTGNIASFTATNPGTTAVTATITVTPVSGTCTGSPKTFTITVNPTPTVVPVPPNQTVCNGAATAPVNFTGPVAGTTFNWVNNTPSIGLAASGSGNISSFNAINTGNVPVTATITVTPVTTPTGSVTFNHTGAVQTWVVPAGVTSINIQAFGAQGNANAAGVSNGGLGGSASGTLAVTPGETLNIYVGGGGTTATAGGFNGGGNAGIAGTCATAHGGGGGGASDVRQGGTALANRMIVAGGGGGTAGNRIAACARGAGGGGGGGYFGGGGGSGYPTTLGVVPTGGTQAAGGAGGITGATFAGPTNGAPGASGQGGNGGNEANSAQAGTQAVIFNGGNGGGTTGVAGQQSGLNNFTGQSGAGGSSYIGGVTGGSTTAGVRTGNGMVVISYATPGPTCTGPAVSFTITVNPTPNAVATPATQTICSGTAMATIVLSGNVSGTTFNWTRNNTVNVTGIPNSGSGNITGIPINNTTVQQIVTYTITPVANGCTGPSITATLIVNKEPTISCPANITVFNAPGQCGANVTYPAATATGSPAPVITYSHASGSFFPVGTTTVTATATNICGVASCTFTITVIDNEQPTITCPANIVRNTDPGVCYATIAVPDPVRADNCAVTLLTWVMTGATTGASPTTGINVVGTRQFNLNGTTGSGLTTITYTVGDAAGNTRTCSFTVTVNDLVLPVISGQPANRTVCVGTSATFSVTAAANGGPIAYQWQQWNGTAWVNIAGANASTYTINNVTLAMNTNTFRVILTGLCSVVTSGAASLYVNALPIVSITPSRPPQLLPIQVLNLTASVSPGGGTYQWFKNGVAIAGATGNSLNGLTVDDQGTYRVRYTDPNGCISTSADLVVSATPTDFVFIYPNPNDGLFHVRFYNTANETATISIFDAKGALAFRRVVTTGNPYTDITVDLAGRNASGVYTVEIRGSGGRLIGAKQLFINNGQ